MRSPLHRLVPAACLWLAACGGSPAPAPSSAGLGVASPGHGATAGTGTGGSGSGSSGSSGASPGTPASTVPAYRISENPWRFELLDDTGAPKLSESTTRTTMAGGALGFQLAPLAGARRYRTGPTKADTTNKDPSTLGWVHATNVISSHHSGLAYDAVLATDDPLGRTLAVHIEQAADRTVTLAAHVVGATTDVEAVGMNFVAPAGTHWFGLGERSHRAEQSGLVVESYVGEGPYQTEEYSGVRAILPPWAIRQRQEDTYFPIPWAMSTDGAGVLVGNDETSWFRFGTPDTGSWGAEVEATSLTLSFFSGSQPAETLRRYVQVVGRQPVAGADWFFGPWFQTGQGDTYPLTSEQGWLEMLQNNDAPISVGETHMHYLPCGTNVGQDDEERARAAMFNAHGLPTLTYFNPILCTSYQPVYGNATSAGVLQKSVTGQPYVYNGFNGGGATVPVTTQVEFDFTNKATQAFYMGLVEPALTANHRGWMEDFGEDTPLDVVAADGTPGDQLHNRYPRDYHCTVQRIANAQPYPLARFVRSGWRGSAPCSPIVWGGDNTIDWGFDGLSSAITTGLTMGLSGVAMWGSDIGGYFATGTRTLTPELLIRWLEFGAASPVMRTKGGGQNIGVSAVTARPQIWEDAIRPYWRRWAKFHTQLNSYLRGAEVDYQASGLPIMRHLILAYPTDPAAATAEDEYLFGPDLLVAPVHVQGAATRSVYLPAGSWVDAWRSLAFDTDQQGGLTMGKVNLLSGAQTVTLPAPLAELPTLVRVGAVLPLLVPVVNDLADFGRPVSVIQARDRADQRVLLAFPRGSGTGRLSAQGTYASRETTTGWTLTVRDAGVASYALQASLATLGQPFTPCAVRLNGQTLGPGQWSFDATTGVLRTTLTATPDPSASGIRAATLDVARCA